MSMVPAEKRRSPAVEASLTHTNLRRENLNPSSYDALIFFSFFGFMASETTVTFHDACTDFLDICLVILGSIVLLLLI
jgi:hypothetical protein